MLYRQCAQSDIGRRFLTEHRQGTQPCLGDALVVGKLGAQPDDQLALGERDSDVLTQVLGRDPQIATARSP